MHQIIITWHAVNSNSQTCIQVNLNPRDISVILLLGVNL
ncbi:hypothetical protein F383_34313 [Gossypium arboreum]|uniref:Uncharacterized protein n=1 Tax=Gossypium arboreum TaxID=29729 RepID=A0A0B0PSY2_GOSAR|nr:hypothetical protein F383_34313 [Gossypium arboreum]